MTALHHLPAGDDAGGPLAPPPPGRLTLVQGWHKYHKRLLRFVRRRFRDLNLWENPIGAEDIVQVTFERAMPHWDKLPPNAYYSYLVTIAKRLVAGLVKDDERRGDADEDEDDLDDPRRHVDRPRARSADDVLDRIEVTGRLKDVPPRQQEALWRRDVEGETSEEIGKDLGCSPGAVDAMVYRARKAARRVKRWAPAVAGAIVLLAVLFPRLPWLPVAAITAGAALFKFLRCATSITHIEIRWSAPKDASSDVPADPPPLKQEPATARPVDADGETILERIYECVQERVRERLQDAGPISPHDIAERLNDNANRLALLAQLREEFLTRIAHDHLAVPHFRAMDRLQLPGSPGMGKTTVTSPPAPYADRAGRRRRAERRTCPARVPGDGGTPRRRAVSRDLRRRRPTRRQTRDAHHAWECHYHVVQWSYGARTGPRTTTSFAASMVQAVGAASDWLMSGNR
ncbi:sigma-70 family RNA polymerase sigma factor [Nonomuraea wenchangensis]